MWSRAMVLMALLAMGLWSVAAGLALSGGPSTGELTADIQELNSQIAAAEDRAGNYGEGSALRAMIELEIAVLSTTRAMIDQRRRAWMRGISLDYIVDGRSVEPADPETFSGIELEISSVKSKIEEARAQAAQYSGGLVLAMALLEEHTNRATLAMLQQRLAISRFGIAIPRTAKGGGPIGQSIDEEGAL